MRSLAMLIAVAVLGGCGIAARAEPVDVEVPARRVMNAHQVTDTIPTPSILEMVNGLFYQHYNNVPAMQAYRLTAVSWGWDSTQIEAWAPFVYDVMLGESAFCWNRRRGDIVKSYSMCVITQQGRYEDVGFGQVTTSFYGADGLLCTKYGVCHSWQILASPYDSMLWSIIVPIELDGSHPWCFNSRARAYHKCGLAPDR